ncbi:MAG: hypothetical protein WCO44_16760 [Bacteroidota bacterium]
MDFDDLDPALILRNNTPHEDFCGLTPAEIHHLLYHGWTERSPIRLQPGITDETMNQVPFFRIAEELIRMISLDQPVKLTKLGFLPIKIVQHLYEQRQISFWYVDMRQPKIIREQDVPAIIAVHAMLKIAGLVKIVKNRLSLTKKGEQILQAGSREKFFRELLIAFTQKWGWGNLDRYDEAYEIQRLWGFSIHLLMQFGHSPQESVFYARKFLVAFPLITEEFQPVPYQNSVQSFESCYCLRTIAHFFEWWGFISREENEPPVSMKNQRITATPVVSNIFTFE